MIDTYRDIMEVPERWEPGHNNHVGQGYFTDEMAQQGLDEVRLTHVLICVIGSRHTITDHPDDPA